MLQRPRHATGREGEEFMAALGKPVRPIIVIKKKVAGAGHHGGAWKVAYADFMTAMMSLFIVLWLLNSTPQIKQAVAGYFKDPESASKETGTKILGTNESIAIDQKNVEKLKEEIEKAILKQADLSKLIKQIEITITDEGLRIDLIEDKGGTFFESGSAKLSENGVKLLDMLSGQLKVLPNHLLIEGHTDAQPYSSDNGYTNWELSSDRANSARRLLQQGGVGPEQISQVRGYADQKLRVPSNPLDPSNRRVSLIVQWVTATGSPVDANAATHIDGANDAASGGAKPQAGPEKPQAGIGDQPDKPNPAVAGASEPDAAHPAMAATPQPSPAKSVDSKPAWIERIKTMVPGMKKQA
jgi:chemotaxis protein MotB